MESGSNRESRPALGDEAVSSPVPEAASAVAAAAAGAEEEAAASPPAPAAGARPYYECVFCKRGFTTAQALGGHMNIHRRDRARPARDSHAAAGITTVSRNVECYNKYRHLASSYPPAAPSTPIPTGGSGGFGMYCVSSGAAAAAAAGLDAEGGSPSGGSPRELSLFGAATGDDHDLHLGLGRHGRAGDSSPAPEGPERRLGEPERELDLELRLGRRPCRH